MLKANSDLDRLSTKTVRDDGQSNTQISYSLLKFSRNFKMDH